MKKILFLIISIFLLSFEGKASHLLGTDLTYECLGPGQYRVSLTLYRDCNGITPSSSQTLYYSSATCNASGSISLSRVGGIVDITPLCPSQSSACGGSGNYGIQQYTYQGTLNLPPGCGADWVLGWGQCCRNSAINTLSSSSSQDMYVGAVLDNTTSPSCNSSPVFNNSPGSIVCVNQPVVYNHGVSDADGDSLYFSFGTCYEGNNNPVNYAGGYNQGNPISTASGLTINPNTGAISFTPNQQQVGVICVNVKEYRNGVLIGEINRDMQFTIIQCSNVPPQATGVDGTPNNDPLNFETDVCANGDLCFIINGTDVNTTNNITMSWNNEIPGANFIVTNNNTPNPTAQFCWNPGPNDIGTHVFTVNVQDDACPIIGAGTYTYIIEVTPSPNTLDAGPNDTICFGDSKVLTATSSPAATSYTWTPAATLSTATGATTTATPLASTTYEVTASFPDGCDLTDIVTVGIAPNPNVSITPSNTFNCSGQATDFSATNSSSYSYTWTPGGMTTADITVYPTATTTYTVDVVENKFGCTASASATVTIAAPANNVCNVLYVSPTGSPTGAGSKADPMDLETAMEVGACNGTTIKMAIGDYVTDTAINKVTSYLTLEGGFDNGTPNWDKISTAGATRILRTATRSTSTTSSSIVQGTGIPNEFGPNPEVVAIEISNQTGFRFQDITIRSELTNPGTEFQGEPGVDVIGVRVSGSDQYSLVRTQINTSQAGKGGNQMWSIPAENGGDARGLVALTNGAGNSLIQTNITAGAAGAGGNSNANGSPSAAAGSAGTSQAIQRTGTAFSPSVSNFNLVAQTTITMDDIACTATNIDFSQAGSVAWNFGAGSTPTTATGASVTSLYNSLGRKNIVSGTNTYTGFANILLDSQVLPAFTTTAPVVQGEYRICAGDNVNFSATNGGTGYNYHWDLGGGAVPNNYDGVAFESLTNISFDVPGVYTIELQFETNCCGLSIPTTIDLYVEERPTPVMPADADLCVGGAPVSLTVGGLTPNGTISWSPSAGLDFNNTTTVNASPGDSTTYNVVLLDSTGLCSNVGYVNVNVINLNLTTSATNATCGPDGTVSVVASGGSGNYAYLWDDPAAQTTATATGLQVGNYNVIVTDLTSGCQDSALAVVNPASGSLVAYVSYSANVSCVGSGDGVLAVSVNGGTAPFDYVWDNGSQTLNTTNTSDTINNLDGGNYEVVITDANSCTYTVSGFVAEPDTMRLEEDTVFNPTCQGAENGLITVFADGGNAPLVVVWNDVNNTVGQTLSNVGVGTYQAVVTDDNGCMDSMSFTLTAPLLTDTIYDTICYQDAYVLPDGSTVNPSNDTTSVDSLVTAIGCDSIVTTYIKVNPVFSLTIMDTICIGDSYTTPGGSIITPLNDTILSDSLTTINGCDSIYNLNISVLDFVVENIDTTICQGSNIIVNGKTYTVSGQYNDTAYYSISGCDSVQYVINLVIDSFVVENYPETICAGETFTVHGFTYDSTGTYNDTLRHVSGCDSIVFSVDLIVLEVNNVVIDTTLCFGDDLTINGTTYTATGVYNDTARYAVSGCDSLIFSVDVEILDEKSGIIDTTLCFGESIMVNGTVYNTSVTNVPEVFTNVGPQLCDSTVLVSVIVLDEKLGVVTDTVCIGESIFVNGTEYNTTTVGAIEVFTNIGPQNCDSTVTVNLLVNPLPSLTATANPDTIYLGDATILEAVGAGDFEWDNIQDGATYQVGPFETTTYNVVLVDSNGCESETSVTVYVIGVTQDQLIIPDAFSPNGDGLNDIFRVVTDQYYEEIEMIIYNRWGEQVHREVGPLNHGWDGNFKGELQAVDSYTYMVRVKALDGNQFVLSGTVALIR